MKNSSVIPNNQSKSETKLTNDSNDYKNHTKDSNQEISSHIETAIITEKVLLADSNDAPPAAASIIEQNAAKIIIYLMFIMSNNVFVVILFVTYQWCARKSSNYSHFGKH